LSLRGGHKLDVWEKVASCGNSWGSWGRMS
jgi:hypothetical protein